MGISVAKLLLTAKQHEIDELRHLTERAELAGSIGHLIHCLQSERGASSLYLASGGKRFASNRQQMISDSQNVQREVEERFRAQLENTSFGSARLLSLMAWALLGMEELTALRQQVEQQQLTVAESTVAFSRLISCLSALIFEITDAALDPDISHALVALFNFIQGKEAAGQERAIGAICFASGRCEATNQQRHLHLIDSQEKYFQTFAEFASDAARTEWTAIQHDPSNALLERLRRILCTSRPDAPFDSEQSDLWFECCSGRISRMWDLQCLLVRQVQDCCANSIRKAETHLADSTGLLQSLRDNPPDNIDQIERFFDPKTPVDRALKLESDTSIGTQLGHSIISVLQAQSTRLASMEDELEKARRTLIERKTIERAKGLLMAQLNLSEEAAYRMLRKTAMDQNRQIIEIAEATLSLPTFAPVAEKTAR